MTTPVMTERIVSPRFKARTATVLWLMTLLAGAFAMLVYGRLVVAGDLAATTTNISAHQALFRTGVASALIATACYIAASLLVYAILKAVNRNVSLLAAFFSLAGYASAAISFAFRLAPLVVMGGAQYLNVFTAEQLQDLTLTFLRWSAQAGNLGLAVFGLYCLLVGYLMFRSTFLKAARAIVRAFKNGHEVRRSVGGTAQPQPR